MIFAEKKKKIGLAMMTLVLAMALVSGFPVVNSYAASGTVYSCIINRSYANPVDGTIEDSGGESNYATGQGMVEGCVYSNGILEVTDDGAYYLTIRMSLMDYTSGHSFWVQNVGDSGWSEPSEMGVTGNGSDSNGTTADVCIRVPSENCVVRVAMYVTSMGRDVIFYLYPSDYSEGNNTDMNAAMVTAASGADEVSDADNNVSSAENNQTVSDRNAAALQSGSGNTSLQSSTANNTASDDETKETEIETESETKKLQNSMTQGEEVAAPASSDSSTLNSAEGLSLSTAQDAAASEGASDLNTAQSSGSFVFQIALAVTISGLILIAAAAGVVYFFRRNWRRWGGGEDNDE